MKKIFCPKCDTAIPLRRERIEELQASGEDRLSIICPQCTHQLNLRLRLPSAKSMKRQEQRTSVGHIIVVENVFGYKQFFPLYVGVNAIGRRNKDTATDIPVITSDPSMDRHHAIIKVTEGRTGKLRFAVADDDSRVGTFLAGELLAPKEWRYLHHLQRRASPRRSHYRGVIACAFPLHSRGQRATLTALVVVDDFLRLHSIVGCLCAYFLLTLQTDCRVLLREVNIQVADYVRNNKLKYKSNVKDLSDYR